MVIRMEATIDVSGIYKTFDGLEREILFALNEYGAKVMRLYLATVSNWKRRPKFEMDSDISSKEAYVVVGTNNDIYRFLHDGTKERWAVMSVDFQPKTHPRVLGVGPGQGKVVLRGRRQFGARPAQPGIKAREWTQEIIARDKGAFQKAMQEAFDRAVQKGGAGI